MRKLVCLTILLATVSFGLFAQKKGVLVDINVAANVDGDPTEIIRSEVNKIIRQSTDYKVVVLDANLNKAINEVKNSAFEGETIDQDQLRKIGRQANVDCIIRMQVTEYKGETTILGQLFDISEFNAPEKDAKATGRVESTSQIEALAQKVGSELLGMATQQPAAQPTATATDDNTETITVNGVSFVMVNVPGGSFDMGAKDVDASSSEKPVHRAHVKNFKIGQTEVTQELWNAVMGQNNASKLPVSNVSWIDVNNFITALNNLTGRHFRLPTEAEWEYAARGGAGAADYLYSGGNILDNLGWYKGNASGRIQPVASLTPNRLGIYDMSGNVWEWTSSNWSEAYDQVDDPSQFVLRGGGASQDAKLSRVSTRAGRVPTVKDPRFGFRLAE